MEYCEMLGLALLFAIFIMCIGLVIMAKDTNSMTNIMFNRMHDKPPWYKG